MRQLQVLVALALLALAPSAEAIQLHWASGAQDIHFTSATQCTLIVSADLDEITLPQTWHLVWAASGCPSLNATIDTLSTDSTLAHVWEAPNPSPAETLTGLRAVTFRARHRSFATAARYVFSLPTGSAGTLQAAASMYSDNSPEEAIVLRSQLATFNGGVSVALPPVVIAARADHPSSQLSVTAKGIRLASIVSAELLSADATWRMPLELATASESTFSATATLPTNAPPTLLKVTLASGSGSASLLAAPACELATNNAVPLHNGMFFTDPNPFVATKDFAFHHNRVRLGGGAVTDLFHLYYIRQRPDLTEPGLGHAWSSDLTHWTVDTVAFLPSKDLGNPTLSIDIWDRVNVWAPSIVEYGDSTFMFYAGVDRFGDQRIGYASTAKLNTCPTDWHRNLKCALSVDSTTWASNIRPFPPTVGQYFRDPHVFAHPNPDSGGKYFMAYVALARPHEGLPEATVVGIARNTVIGDLSRWKDLGYYRSTDPLRVGFSSLEGPIVFPDRGSPTRWLMMFSNASNSATGPTSIRFKRAAIGAPPSDTSLILAGSPNAAWPATSPLTLYPYVGSDLTAWGWNGTEYLDLFGQVQYLAGFTAWGPGAQGIEIARLNWIPGSGGREFNIASSPVTGIDVDRAQTAAVRLRTIEVRPNAGRISWLITAPGELAVKLDVFDVFGRRVRRLLDDRIQAGSLPITWDTKADDGNPVHSAIYYARLSFAGGARVAVVPITR